jgi:lipoprotein LenA
MEEPMRTFTVIVMTAALVLGACCSKDGGSSSDTPIARKFARYTAPVYRDREFTQWLTALEKGESVDLLTEEKYTTQGKQAKTLSKIRLSDDKVGYTESAHLADGVVVFTADDVKTFQRPNAGAPLGTPVAKGTIGFITEEKADWVKVFTWRPGDKWGSEQWVKEGFSANESLVRDAREYEKALTLLVEAKKSSRDKARETLTELAAGDSVIAALAKKRLDRLSEATDGQDKTRDDGGKMQDAPAGKK